jgi:hypothetical protein
MAETVVSIHRKQDLRSARALAEHCRLKLRAPPSAVTVQVIERLADMLGEERVWRHNEMARFRAELEHEGAQLREEMTAETARILTLLDAAEAFVKARKALNEALAARGRA